MERKSKTQQNFKGHQDPKLRSKTNRILEDSDQSDSDDDQKKKKLNLNLPTGGIKMDMIGDDSDDDGPMLFGANKQ